MLGTPSRPQAPSLSSHLLTRFNQITLSGFGFVIINFLTMLWYTPTLDQDCPSWVYLSWAIGLFLYQTFDAVDGSQARRTHQSGPLGELFDHGVDAINTTLEVLLFSATMNLGQGWKTVLTLFACKWFNACAALSY
jgi:ethanolaminephosphotransferase